MGKDHVHGLDNTKNNLKNTLREKNQTQRVCTTFWFSKAKLIYGIKNQDNSYSCLREECLEGVGSWKSRVCGAKAFLGVVVFYKEASKQARKKEREINK